MRAPTLLAGLLLPTTLHADVVLQNWYQDPFFQVRSALPHCPPPLGPYTTETDMKQQAHWRAERGTSCWLAGKCKKANAYLYDADIAADLQQRFASTGKFRDASLWITVQRRFVYVEGCVRSRKVVSGLEAFIRQTADVELVSINTMPVTIKQPSYAVWPKS